jgi:hypothetical protein
MPATPTLEMVLEILLLDDLVTDFVLRGKFIFSYETMCYYWA